MKDIREIEQAILTKLQTDIPDLLVISYPDNPLEYQLNHPVGAVLVLYDGLELSDPFAMVRTVQNETHRFKTGVVVRSLSGPDGAYAQLNRVHASLSDYRISGCLPMFATSIVPNGESNGIWAYTINWVVEVKLA